jgi:tetratricopeptide (TPR) repeat protein
MGALFTFSLAKREGGEDSFSIHTMIQTCTRERLSQSEKQRLVEKAVLVVAGAATMVLDSPSNWIASRQLLSHVASCQKHLGHPLQDNEPFRSTRALSYLRQFCNRFSQHDLVITWFRKELDCVQDLSLPSLEVRDGISRAMLSKGQLQEALAEFESLYAEAGENIGVEHILTYGIANSLGMAYKKLGRYGKALNWYQVALTGAVNNFGEANQAVLATLNNIAIVQKELKQYSLALKTYEKVLRGKEAAFGKENSSTLESVMNIGVVYLHCHQYGDALSFLQRALSGKEKCWGKDSPDTIDVKGNIARVYLEQGRLQDAITLYKEVLDGYKKAYGSSMHQSIFNKTGSLGDAYCQQGCYGESLQ